MVEPTKKQSGAVPLTAEGRNPKTATQLDPVTIEVIHNALTSFIKEMRHTIIRTSFGPNLRERHDFSCALQDPNGELVAIFQDNPPHIVPTVYAVRAALDRFGDDIHRGDVVIVNDPYILGGHMNDVAHLYPVFAGGRLIFWMVIRIHYTDIGGMAPGSITPDSTDVYQEGIRIPPVKAYQADKPNHAFLDVLFANVRVPEERKADFMAVVASFWTSEKRFQEILSAHGVDAVVRCGEVVRDRAERRMRDAISRLPDGDYAYELNLDSDGFEQRWIPIRVKVRIEGDSITVDFSDSAASVVGPMNGSEASLREGDQGFAGGDSPGHPLPGTASGAHLRRPGPDAPGNQCRSRRLGTSCSRHRARGSLFPCPSLYVGLGSGNRPSVHHV